MGPIIIPSFCGEAALAWTEYLYVYEDSCLGKPSIGVGAVGWCMKLAVPSAYIWGSSPKSVIEVKVP